MIEKRLPIQKKTGIPEESRFWKLLKMKSDSAKDVEIISRQQTLIKDFVQKSVITFGNIMTKVIKLNSNARYVVIHLTEINISNLKHADLSVRINYQQIKGVKTLNKKIVEVYDLEIEDTHEYFANGVLVHNCDPNAFGRVGLSSQGVFIELLCYEPIDNAFALSEMYRGLGIPKSARIIADSADKYNDQQMVMELHDLGWRNVEKADKSKGLLHSIGQLKKHKIHIVHNVNAKREQENYKWREINGILINEPIDKWNHFWDMSRYAFSGLTEPDFYIKRTN